MQKGMSIIVKTMTRIVISFIFIYGASIILYGHLTPGGGFPGGVIIACGFVLLTLAFGKEETLKKLSIHWSEALDSTGSIIYLSGALLGYFGGWFFFNFLEHGILRQLISAGIIPIYNIAIGIKVCASLFLAFISLSMFRRSTE